MPVKKLWNSNWGRIGLPVAMAIALAFAVTKCSSESGKNKELINKNNELKKDLLDCNSSDSINQSAAVDLKNKTIGLQEAIYSLNLIIGGQNKSKNTVSNRKSGKFVSNKTHTSGAAKDCNGTVINANAGSNIYVGPNNFYGNQTGGNTNKNSSSADSKPVDNNTVNNNNPQLDNNRPSNNVQRLRNPVIITTTNQGRNR